MLYIGSTGCVCVCWRGSNPRSKVFSQSSSAVANSPRRGSPIHRNTGCRLQQIQSCSPQAQKRNSSKDNKSNSFTMFTFLQDHCPLIVSLQSCLGLLLTEDQAGQFLKNALRLNTSFFGPTHLHTALK